ncbi:unnamed protein product [Sphenostylis stenocarpa]|uniref:Uncharacterized protein n=1 Tax=Sphenostylis stenocarpa TaxID=92480 RepID=A0AA87B6K1_9FABA|nr:unnamed protein product [Sphenostylis stenocarpa]
MQTPVVDPILLVCVLLAVLLGSLMWPVVRNLTRPRGIHGAFINEDEAEQNASGATISADDGISEAFINRRKGVQNLGNARIEATRNSGSSSGAANPVQYQLWDIFLQFIAYVFGGGKKY